MSDAQTGPHTLGIDIGGTGLKAAVLDADGKMVDKRVRAPTPSPATPSAVLGTLDSLIKPLPPFDRISIGFPGVVRRGAVITAPNLGTKAWRGFALQDEISKMFGKPARLENDAEVAGLGVIDGKGLEVVITLGTGFGSAIFSDGRMTPHLELAHHPVHKSETYDDYVGNAAMKAVGQKKWNRRVLRVIAVLRTLLNYDTLHIGGGNATHITFKLPEKVILASNDKGITGGIRLWEEGVWHPR
jgi:polyphosphate glucokinase